MYQLICFLDKGGKLGKWRRKLEIGVSTTILFVGDLWVISIVTY